MILMIARHCAKHPPVMDKAPQGTCHGDPDFVPTDERLIFRIEISLFRSSHIHTFATRPSR
jgi:hypothetical protein